MADDAANEGLGFTELLPLGPDDTPYRLVSTEGISTFETPEGTFLKVEEEAIRLLTAEAMHVPTLFSRKREISGDGLAVELTPGRRPTVRVTGKRGSRLVGANPLVAGADLRRWFDALPGDTIEV